MPNHYFCFKVLILPTCMGQLWMLLVTFLKAHKDALKVMKISTQKINTAIKLFCHIPIDAKQSKQSTSGADDFCPLTYPQPVLLLKVARQSESEVGQEVGGHSVGGPAPRHGGKVVAGQEAHGRLRLSTYEGLAAV